MNNLSCKKATMSVKQYNTARLYIQTWNKSKGILDLLDTRPDSLNELNTQLKVKTESNTTGLRGLTINSQFRVPNFPVWLE